MTKALQLLYSAEYFLRRQLQQSTTTAPDELLGGADNATLASNGGDGLINGVDPYADLFSQQPPNGTDNQDSSQSKGRTVLTILYLCVLALCFVVPVFYYFRLHCFEEYARRELEMDFTTALEQSEHHRDEARAARRKYIDERRARIVQLFGPVRMVRAFCVSVVLDRAVIMEC